MIQATELRIGNWVNHPNEGIQIAASDITDRYLLGVVEPISLTPEILEKCGFEKHDNSNEFWTFWVLKNGWYIGHSHHNEPSAGTEVGKFYWGDNYTEVKNLHHLMNLYFALTGQELIYKP